ncbi:hypothetical protein P4J24_30625 [Bacillus anthracis]|nr:MULTISPECIES: hypothetical protein [Bacillus cereus group]MEB9686139.1 hypothetical protein [Bacillus anthracis]
MAGSSPNGKIQDALAYLEGLSSMEEVESYVLAPLMAEIANGFIVRVNY